MPNTHGPGLQVLCRQSWAIVTGLMVLTYNTALSTPPAPMEKGKVSTNIYLRRIHNFALGMSWLRD